MESLDRVDVEVEDDDLEDVEFISKLRKDIGSFQIPQESEENGDFRFAAAAISRLLLKANRRNNNNNNFVLTFLFAEKNRQRSRTGLKKMGIILGVTAAVVVIVILIIAIVIFKFKPGDTDSTDNSDAVLQDLSNYMLGAMDPTADPCQDFYRYACGTWLDKNQQQVPLLGDSEMAFSEVQQRIQNQLTTLLESQPDPLLNTMYSQCLNDPRELFELLVRTVKQVCSNDQATLQLLLQWLNMPMYAANLTSIVEVVAIFHKSSIEALFSVDVQPDPKMNDRNILNLVQGGLTLPNRDVYLNKDDENIALFRSQILKAMASTFDSLEQNSILAKQMAEAVFAFETDIAVAHMDSSLLNNPNDTYHKLTLEELHQLTPSINWTLYFDVLLLPPTSAVLVPTIEFFPQLDRILKTTPIEVIQWYLQWHFLYSVSIFLQQAPELSDSVLSSSYADWLRIIRGVNSPNPSQQQLCVEIVNELMGDLLGVYYVKQYVTEGKKTVAGELIRDVKDSFESNLVTLSWIDLDTRLKMQEKLEAITSKLLHPSTPPDYSSVTLQGHFLQNAMTLLSFQVKRQIAQLDKPVDRSQWMMTPQTVNAYYNPIWNEIVIPAGILQTPFFNDSYPEWNYFGAITYVLGHEITHGFDNQGRWFDANGTLRDWWGESMEKTFQQKAQCVVDAYDKYEVMPGLFVEGNVTEGENIADLGGLRLAFNAYQAHVIKNGNKGKFTDAQIQKYFPGLSNEKLFFLTFGQLWCDAAGDLFEDIFIVRSNEHSPSRFRVLGSVSNTDIFAKTFNCPVGTPMNPSHQCRVW